MTNALTMFVETAIYGRRAVRAYTAQPVARETIEQLIDAAIQAPSSMDLEPWAFVVIDGVARLKGFSDRAKAAFVPGPMTGAAAEHFRNMLVDPAFNIFHDAPALIVVCATSEAGQAVEDCSLAAQNLKHVAHPAGADRCALDPRTGARRVVGRSCCRPRNMPDRFLPAVATPSRNETRTRHRPAVRAGLSACRRLSGRAPRRTRP